MVTADFRYGVLLLAAACGDTTASADAGTEDVATPAVDAGGADADVLADVAQEADAQKPTILAYLASQSPANGGGIVNGAYVDLYASNSGGNDPLDDFFGGAPNDASKITEGKCEPGNTSAPTTGLAPAILGFQWMTNDGVSLGFPYPTYSTLPYVNSWIAAGGIPLMGGWVANPINTSTVKGPISANNLLNVASSNEYKTWQKHLGEVAAYFKKVKGTILYRPFVEPNLNGSFWWDRASFTPQQQVAIYVQEWTYMKDAGVTNVIWIFNANAGVGHYVDAYPGDPYVDLVSMDAYPIANDSVLGGMYQAMTTPVTTVTGVKYTATKPLFFAEAGISPNASHAYHTGNWDDGRALVASQMPKVFAITTWFQGEQPGNQLGEEAFMQNTIDRAHLPAFAP